MKYKLQSSEISAVCFEGNNLNEILYFLNSFQFNNFQIKYSQEEGKIKFGNEKPDHVTLEITIGNSLISLKQRDYLVIDPFGRLLAINESTFNRAT